MMKTRIFRFMLLLLASAILAACGPSQAELDATATKVAVDIFATQTAQAPTATPTLTPSLTSTTTPTATPTPTRTATITPMPTPRLMAAALTLDDLPSGFRAMTPEELEPGKQNLPKNAIIYGFLDAANTQIVMGYSVPLASRIEQNAFDEMLPEMIDVYSAAVGAKTTPEMLPGLEDVGEASVAFTFETQLFSETLRWDMVIFRRGEIAEFLFVAYPDGDEPVVPIGDLALLLDNRISGLLGLSAKPNSLPDCSMQCEMIIWS